MSEDAKLLLQRAGDCLDEAQTLYEAGLNLGAINRAYYCVFDCIRALLSEQDVFAKTHQGVLLKFNELFIKSNRLSLQYSEWARFLLDLRQAADYDLTVELTVEDAVRALEIARQFRNGVEDYFSEKI